MAGNKKVDADALDDLLNFDDVVEAVPAEPEPAVETVAEEVEVPTGNLEDEATAAAKARIAELQAELAKPLTNPTDEDGRPLEISRLTPEQRLIRELEDKLAERKTKEAELAPERFEQSDGDDDSILIHFVADGFTTQGRLWYIGQELEFSVSGTAYEQTKDRFGNSWVHLTEDEQYDKYGKVYFRPGPWRGKDYDNDAAAVAERKRNRAAPVVTI